MFVKKLIPFAVAASFAMAGAAFAKTEFVTIGTGGITGVYYPTGGAIAKIVNAKKDQYGVRASVESTGGSKFNINAIDSKDLDFGIAQADTQYMAYNGKGAWEGKPVKKLRAVFALAPEAVTFVAAEDANIKSVKDVKGKTINLGDPASSLCRKICSGVMPQRLWHSSPNLRTSASVVSGLISNTPSRMGEHPATLIIFPFFPLRSLSFSCMARPVFSLTICLILS